MGKKLIILGADFSADSITEEIWYQTENTVWTGNLGNGGTANRFSYAGAMLKSETLGKPINLVRMDFNKTKVTNGNVFTLGVVTLNGNINDVEPLISFSLTTEDKAAGYVTVKLPSPVIITSQDQTIAVGLDGKNYMPISYTEVSEPESLRGTSWGTSGVVMQATYRIAMSFGFTE